MGWRADKESLALWAASGLLTISGSILGYYAMQASDDIRALQATSSAREAFGTRDREDIIEIKQDVKEVKQDIKDILKAVNK